MDPALDAAWQAFRNETTELRAQSAIERARPAADRVGGDGAKDCWRLAGIAEMHGGKLPRP